MTTADVAVLVEAAATQVEVWVAVVVVVVTVLATAALVALAVWTLKRLDRNRRYDDDNRGRWPS